MINNEGYSFGKVTGKMRELFHIQKHFFHGRELDALNLRTYVCSINGLVTKIKREEKIIVLNDEECIPYELLFLMCGESFQLPNSLRKHTKQDCPDNLFIINNAIDATGAIKMLKIVNIDTIDSKCIHDYCNFSNLDLYRCI